MQTPEWQSGRDCNTQSKVRMEVKIRSPAFPQCRHSPHCYFFTCFQSYFLMALIGGSVSDFPAKLNGVNAVSMSHVTTLRYIHVHDQCLFKVSLCAPVCVFVKGKVLCECLQD